MMRLTRYIEKKSIPIITLWWLYQSLPSASISTFLCTRNLRPEEVSVADCSLSAEKLITAWSTLSKVLNNYFLMSETQQLIIFTFKRFLHHLYTVSVLYIVSWASPFAPKGTLLPWGPCDRLCWFMYFCILLVQLVLKQ